MGVNTRRLRTIAALTLAAAIFVLAPAEGRRCGGILREHVAYADELEEDFEGNADTVELLDAIQQTSSSDVGGRAYRRRIERHTCRYRQE